MKQERSESLAMDDDARVIRLRVERLNAGAVWLESILRKMSLEEFQDLEQLLKECIELGSTCAKTKFTLTSHDIYAFECACDRLLVAYVHHHLRHDPTRDP